MKAGARSNEGPRSSEEGEPGEGVRAVGRPRDRKATDAIQEAALAIAEAEGWDAVTFEAIAARARVTRPTIYRRWHDVWAILVDAILAEVDMAGMVVRRATVRESMAASLKLLARVLRGRVGGLLRALVGRAQHADEARRVVQDHWVIRRRPARRLVEAGIERGELRAGTDPDVVLDALYGALYHRLLLPCDGPEVRLSDAYVDALVDLVFSGVENPSTPGRSASPRSG